MMVGNENDIRMWFFLPYVGFSTDAPYHVQSHSCILDKTLCGCAMKSKAVQEIMIKSRFVASNMENY
jgi:hypothetical protein